MPVSDRPYVLGLDLGVQSVGWAVLDLDEKGRPCGVRRSGVRCFDSGVGNETEIASGKDESQNIKRRQARLQRRQLWRRGRRLKKVFHLLQKAGLLPSDEARTPQQRHELLKKLDLELAKTYVLDHDRVAGHLLPYRLRTLALDQPLPPFAFGRALFHLAQRRGFLSNRKSAAKDDKESGDVKAGISELRRSMDEAGARTLGEYFAGLDPEEQRIRKRWTARDMYLDEFEKIWSGQATRHVDVGDEWKQQIHDAIFHQRPLKSQKHLVGMCELEPGCRRAPWASLEAQRFRYLQKVNDLEISTPDGDIWRLIDPQHAGLRAKLIELLDNQVQVEFKSLRSKLGLKKPAGTDAEYRFNLEAGGEKKLKGNATAFKLRKVLGNDFDRLTPAQVACIVEDLLEYEKEDKLAERLTRNYGVGPDTAAQLATVTLEDGYASLSREAMQKLLPLLESGRRIATMSYAERRELFPGMTRSEVCALLPPVLDVSNMRNPVVCRGLTELRKVVNALIRQYGKPELIRVELARDLKKSRSQREDLTRKNRDNEKLRDAARRKIAARLGCDESEVSGLDILKVRLAEECNWECPYTGRQIAIESLVGKHAQFDIEHIIPFSRSLDNSFLNKTLCYHEENRSVKRNQTPHDAYSGNEERWHEIIARVGRFRGSAAHPKLRKFQQKELGDDWAARMLQDTRYMSRLAMEYLGLLYDAGGRRRVQVSAGRITAYLRDEWGLNAILADGDEDEKNRDDHRHHAVDAVVIALTDAATVELLSRSAELAEERGHRLFTPVDKPWPTLVEDIRRSIDGINISYRVNRRVSGALHEETLYSKAYKSGKGNGKASEYRHVRKPLQAMSLNEVENIVDDTIRRLVLEKLEQVGGDPNKVFADDGNRPYLTAKDGRRIFINKARIKKAVAVVPLGTRDAQRYAAPGTNHHMEIVAVVDEHGTERSWTVLKTRDCDKFEEPVSLFEAAERVRTGQPVVQRDHGPNTKFKFSLAGGEYVEMDDGQGNRSLYRVTVISGKQVEFRLHTDARPITLLKKIRGARVRCSVGALFKAKARKVVIDPLGNVLPAND
ncbi:MAG: type II CRISPR RNA-guided endonuclease Cas9 [Planctomycetaceae bacterium]|nr:type II CRISPR RNA-guided endonuclease Cas9 [Planctomycetaceae bacterium]